MSIAGLAFFFSAICELFVKDGPWWRAMIAIAAGLFLILLGFIFARREEEKQRAKEVVVTSFSGRSMIYKNDSVSPELGEEQCFLKISNASSKPVHITHVWLEGCAGDGKDLHLMGAPQSIEPGGYCIIQVERKKVMLEEWFEKARVKLHDDRVLRSKQDTQMPAIGIFPGQPNKSTISPISQT